MLLDFQNLDRDSDLGWRPATATEKLVKMYAGHSSSFSGSTDDSEFAGNSQGIGCNVDLGGTAMLMETVEVIYAESPGGANRIVVDLIHHGGVGEPER